MIAEIVINRSAKKLNRTFDYGIPKELEELIMIGSAVLVPFGKSENLVEGYVIGIKEKTEYEVKEVKEIKHNLTKKQIELAKWMAKRYFCNISDCIKQMLAPGTKNKKAENNIQDKMINMVYLKKETEEIQFDIDMGKIKSEKQKKILMFLKNNNGVTVPEIEMFTGGTRAIVKTLEKNGYVEIIEKKVERNPLINKKVEKTSNLQLTEEQEKAYEKVKGKIKSNSSIKGSGIFVKGETGNGIEKIEKTNTEGLIDTYTIYYTDKTTSTFQVSNGGKGDKGDKPIKGVDYFTPAEVQNIQKNILDNVNQFSVEVVETLPIQNIKDHTIYFVPKTTAEQNDIYDEYIYINNSWEHIGNAIKNKRLKLEGKSEQTGEPTVANPVKIRNIGDNINLFDKSLIGTNYKYNNGSKLDRDNLRTTTIILTEKIKPGKYTVSFKYGSKSTSNNFGIQFLNGSKAIINVTFTTEKTKTFTINGEVDRLYFYINTAQASGIVLYLDEIKLEEGSTATPYTEYGCGSIDYKATNDSDGNLKNNRFKIEYNYDNLFGGEEAYYNHHIYWRNKYLHIEPHSKKEKKAIEKYLEDRKPSLKKDEEYDSGIYQKKQTNIIAYETTDFKENQKVEYLATKQETKKIKNQILCNK